MRKLLPVLCCACVLHLPAAHAADYPAPVAQALKHAGIPQAATAVWVAEVDATRPRLAVNARAALNPASTMKLVTTYAALDLLGPAYVWKTEAYATGALADGVLDGDLVLKGYGDPKLSLEQLAELTDSSKSYIWELENKDDPKPSAEKIGKIATVLEVTTEFLLTESATTPDEEVLDEAFFRKYKNMSEPDKKKIRKILDAWEDE